MMVLLFNASFKCNPITLQPEQTGRQGSIPSRAPELERHGEGREGRGGGAVSHILPKSMK